MRVLSLKVGMGLSLAHGQKANLIKDDYYVFDERFVKEFELVYGSELFGNELNIDSYIKPYLGQNLDGKSLFCFRTSGIGDLMAMMVPIRILKKKYPTCKIIVGSSNLYKDLFENDPDVNEFIPSPWPLKYLTDNDCSMYFQGLVENYSIDSTSLNIYDLFLKAFGLDYNNISSSDKKPKVFLDNEVEDDIAITFEGLGLKDNSKGKVIGVQLETSTIIRNYPIFYFKQIISKLNIQGIRTVIIGEPILTNTIEQYGLCDNKMSFDFAQHCLTLNHLISIINNCDAIIGPDTSGLHIAGALNKPMVGLFGPIPSDLRICYFKNAIGIDGKTLCHPCFIHGNNPCRYSVSKEKYSPCMQLIDPDTVVKALNDNILPILGVSDHKSSPVMPKITPKEKRAIVTLVIGDKARSMLDIGFDLLTNYADKTHSRLVVINEEKIKLEGFPNLEKFQIVEILDNYDRVLYLDADILIHPNCPDIFDVVSNNSFGAVTDNTDNVWGNLNRYDEMINVQRSLGYIKWYSGYFNTGVMLLSKEHKGIFDNPSDRLKFESQFSDQTLLNYNFVKYGYKFYCLDKKFNGMEINSFSSRMEPQNKTKAYIMHFAREGDRLKQMKFIKGIIDGD